MFLSFINLYKERFEQEEQASPASLDDKGRLNIDRDSLDTSLFELTPSWTRVICF